LRWRWRLLLLILLLAGIAVGIRDPIAILVVGAVGAGLRRRGWCWVRINGSAGVAGIIVVARIIGVPIGDAES
jgi:hypothetical protein